MMDLKAELQKKGLEFKAKKQNRPETVPVNKKARVLESSKKPNLLPVKGSLKSVTAEKSKAEDDILEKSRLKLEEKSKLYDRIRYGDVDDVSPEILNNILVDFDRKDWNEEKQMYDLPPREQAQIEKNSAKKRVYVDEFGRTRQIDEEQVALNHDSIDDLVTSLRPQDTEAFEDEIIRDAHYDDSGEIRTKGVGFYRFSQNEADRQSQMNDLTALRQNTLESRTQLMVMKEKRRQMKEARLKKVEERRSRVAQSSLDETTN